MDVLAPWLKANLDRHAGKSTDPPPQKPTAQDLQDLDGGALETPRLRAVRALLDLPHSEPAETAIKAGDRPTQTSDQIKERDQLIGTSKAAIATLAIAPFWRHTTVGAPDGGWSVTAGVPRSTVKLPFRQELTLPSHKPGDYGAAARKVAETMRQTTALDLLRMWAQSQNPGLGFAIKLGLLKLDRRLLAPFTLIAIDVVSAWVATTVQLLKYALQVPRPDARIFGAGIQPILPVPAFTAYPGGHAAQCAAIAELLAAIACRSDATAVQELKDYSAHIAGLRENAGLHCHLDTDAGLQLGSELAKSMIAAASDTSPMGREFISWSAVYAQAQQEWG